MGDPKKARKQYEGPKHPWEATRINEERTISKKYGLKNKKEIWKMQSILKKLKRQAKALIARRDQQAEKEQALLMKRLHRLGLLGKDAKIESVLGLSLDDVMKLRLQTAVYNKGIAKTITQARQLVVHGHIKISGKKVTVPSYILESGEEDKIAFSGKFTLTEDKPSTLLESVDGKRQKTSLGGKQPFKKALTEKADKADKTDKTGAKSEKIEVKTK